MLTDSELQDLFDRLGLTNEARALVDAARKMSPTRRVSGRAGNMTVRFPSRKMQFVVQAESHRVEFAGVLEYEFDNEVLEYYDQPPKISLKYQTKDNKNLTVWSTPDYLVIRRNSICWEEWKTEESLVKLCAKSPNRFVRSEDGQWHCPPGETFASGVGLSYRLRTSRDIDWVYLRNIDFLADYLDPDFPAVDEAVATTILNVLNSSEPGISLYALLNMLEPPATSDDIYALIAKGQLYVDLHSEVLAEPRRVRVFRDKAMADGHPPLDKGLDPPLRSNCILSIDPGVTVVWDSRSWQILNRGLALTSLLDDSGKMVELPNEAFESLVQRGAIIAPLQNATDGLLEEEGQRLWNSAGPEQQQKALARYNLIATDLEHEEALFEPTDRPNSRQKSLSRSERSRLRYRLAFLGARQIYGNGLVGLLDHYSGNRKSRISAELLKFTETYITEEFENKKQKKIESVYIGYKKASQAEGYKPVSKKKFRQLIKKRPRDKTTENREGKRAAYQFKFPWELDQATPRHGDRPMQIGHIDHTLLDIMALDSSTGQLVGRVWATFFSDAYSRRLLAIYVSFDPPSYRSCMAVVRICVQRFGRLPQYIVVDGAKEFKSLYFELLLARYGAAKKTRPWAEPHFGSTCERLFDTANTEFIHNLIGNTQLTKRVRLITKAVDPARLAEWTIGELYAGLCIWGYEVYDRAIHSTLGESPRDAFERGLIMTGKRPNRMIRYSREFIIDTLPTTRKGTSKVQISGVKINHIYYSCTEFRDSTIQGKTIPIRYDPFDVGLAYAYVTNRWVECHSDYYAQLKGHSELELRIATNEILARKSARNQQVNVSQRELADFFESIEGRKLTEQQRDRDAEQRKVAALVDIVFQALYHLDADANSLENKSVAGGPDMPSESGDETDESEAEDNTEGYLTPYEVS